MFSKPVRISFFTISIALQTLVIKDCVITKKMAPTDVVVPKPPTSPRPPETPPSSPCLASSEQLLTMKHVEQFLDLLKAVQANQAPQVSGEINQQANNKDPSEDKQQAPSIAPKLEFKTGMRCEPELVHLMKRFADHALPSVGIQRRTSTRSLSHGRSQPTWINMCSWSASVLVRAATLIRTTLLMLMA